jgi:hypothetical protein
MEIAGYKYIAHKLIERPWGPECRFTLSREGKPDFNEVIAISNLKIEEKDLIELIEAHIMRGDVEREPEPEIEPAVTQVTVEQYLKDNGYLAKEETLDTITTLKTDLAEAKALTRKAA